MILATTPLSALTYVRPITVSEETSVFQAIALARRSQVHHLPVARRDIAVGFACTCDLEGVPGERLMSDVMRKPVSIDREASALDAARLMKEHGIGSVLLTSGDSLFGIVTRGDLVRVFPQAEETLGASRCFCCGLTRHLTTQMDGRVTCIYCAGATEADWLLTGATN